MCVFMVSVFSIRPWLSTIQNIHFQFDLKTMIQYMWEQEKNLLTIANKKSQHLSEDWAGFPTLPLCLSKAAEPTWHKVYL